MSVCLNGMLAGIFLCLTWLPQGIASADVAGAGSVTAGGSLTGGSITSDGSYRWYRESTDKLIVKYSDPALARSIAPPAEHVAALSVLAGVQLTHLRRMSGDSQVYLLPRRTALNDVSAIAEKLKAAPAVEYAEPDRLMFPATVPNDPRYPQQWQYKSPQDNEVAGMNLPAAWGITTGSSSVVVGVIDTGIVDHVDLQGRVVPGYNFISDPVMAGNGIGRTPDPHDMGDWLPSDQQCSPLYGNAMAPSSWHGTKMAGIIGAAANNGTGVAGMNWNSKILPVRVLGKCGGYWSDIADGLRWAAGVSADESLPVNQSPARVLNLSLGRVGACTPSVQSAIDDVVNAGAVVVAAAGNENGSAALFTPGNCNRLISVAATDRGGRIAMNSNYGPRVDIAAPGGGVPGDGILSLTNTGLDSPAASPAGDTYTYSMGTSVAAAHVAGTASLMLSANPALTPVQVTKLLQWAARPFETVSNDYWSDCSALQCGAGLLDTYAAVLVANANAPVISTSPRALDFQIPINGVTPPTQTLLIENPGSGTLNWTVSSNTPWLRISNTSGENSGAVTVSVDVAALPGPGPYEGTLTIGGPYAFNPSLEVPVHARRVLDLHAPLPIATSLHALAAVDGRIYAIGGTAGGSNVQIYDTATGTWSFGAGKPTPVAEINAAVVDGKIYVPGGTKIVGGRVADVLEIYDPAADSWSTGSSLPSPVSGYTLQTANGKIYLIGGYDFTIDDSGVFRFIDRYGYVYDPASDAWSEMPRMQQHRSDLASGTAEGKIYVSGGSHWGPNGYTPVGYTESFDPATGVWSPEGAMSGVRKLHAGAGADGRNFVLGGIDETNHEQDLVELYDAASKTWKRMPFTLNSARGGARAVVVGERIFVVGGQKYYSASSDLNESFPLYWAGMDSSPPAVTSFSLPGQSSALTVPVTGLAATDDTGVTGYLITTDPAVPGAAAAGWTPTPPAQFTVGASGLFTCYAWAKDAAGNVSAAKSAQVLFDDSPPRVALSVKSAVKTLSVPVKVYAVDYDSGITGYMIKQDPTPPLAASGGWSVTPPTSVAFTTAGTKILYVWAKNGVGNVSDARTARVVIDTTPPVATFTAKSAVNTLTVPVTVAASDGAGGSGVAGYMIKTTSTPPLASSSGWSATAPTSYTCASLGINTLYLWVKDAAGNVSAARSVKVNVDRLAPVVTVAMKGVANTLTVLFSFTASDGSGGSGVTGYKITTTSTPPLANSTNWSVTPLRGYTFSTTGFHGLYFWAKDAAGNVSKVQGRGVNIDMSPPFVATVSVVSPANSLRVPLSITAFDTAGGSGVDGYMVTATLTPPLASATGWSATFLTSYTFTSPGSKTFYVWARDRAGNVSAPKAVKVSIDTTAPTLTLTAKTPVSTLTVPVLLRASDGTGGSGIAGYMIKSSEPQPAEPGWTATPPTGYTFASKGVKILYVWAKDGAGNISPMRSATVVIQ